MTCCKPLVAPQAGVQRRWQVQAQKRSPSVEQQTGTLNTALLSRVVFRLFFRRLRRRRAFCKAGSRAEERWARLWWARSVAATTGTITSRNDSCTPTQAQPTSHPGTPMPNAAAGGAYVLATLLATFSTVTHAPADARVGLGHYVWMADGRGAKHKEDSGGACLLVELEEQVGAPHHHGKATPLHRPVLTLPNTPPLTTHTIQT